MLIGCWTGAGFLIVWHACSTGFRTTDGVVAMPATGVVPTPAAGGAGEDRREWYHPSTSKEDAEGESCERVPNAFPPFFFPMLYLSWGWGWGCAVPGTKGLTHRCSVGRRPWSSGGLHGDGPKKNHKKKPDHAPPPGKFGPMSCGHPFWFNMWVVSRAGHMLSAVGGGPYNRHSSGTSRMVGFNWEASTAVNCSAFQIYYSTGPRLCFVF